MGVSIGSRSGRLRRRDNPRRRARSSAIALTRIGSNDSDGVARLFAFPVHAGRMPARTHSCRAARSVTASRGPSALRQPGHNRTDHRLLRSVHACRRPGPGDSASPGAPWTSRRRRLAVADRRYRLDERGPLPTSRQKSTTDTIAFAAGRWGRAVGLSHRGAPAGQ